MRRLVEGMALPESEFDRAAEERRFELHEMIYRAPAPYEPPAPADPYALEEIMPGLEG